MTTFEDPATDADEAQAGLRALAFSTVEQVSWELRRSAEIMGQVLDSIGQAQSAEATITYERPNRSDLSTPRRSTVHRGLGL